MGIRDSFTTLCYNPVVRHGKQAHPCAANPSANGASLPTPAGTSSAGFLFFSEFFTTSLQVCAEFFTYVWYDQGTTADKDAERLPQDGKDGRRFRRANGGKLVSAGLILPAEVSASAGFCFCGGLRFRVTPDAHAPRKRRDGGSMSSAALRAQWQSPSRAPWQCRAGA